MYVCTAGADPAFLERGFISIKGWGLAWIFISHFSEISHFHRIFKNGEGGGQEGEFEQPPWMHN